MGDPNHPQASTYKAHMIMSIVLLVFSLCLLISGAVGASYKLPEGSGSAADREEVEKVLGQVSIGGAIPGAASFLFALLGAIGGAKQNKGLVTAHLVFAIILIIVHIIFLALPLLGAAVFQTSCDAIEAACQSDISCSADDLKDLDNFCTQFVGSLWAAVVFGIFCAIMNFAVSVSGCCLTCCAKEAPAQSSNPVVQQGVPVAQPVQ